LIVHFTLYFCMRLYWAVYRGMSLVCAPIADPSTLHKATLHHRCSCVHGTQVPPQTVSRTEAVTPAYSMLFLGPKHIRQNVRVLAPANSVKRKISNMAVVQSVMVSCMTLLLATSQGPNHSGGCIRSASRPSSLDWTHTS
jgi:hypothetical protein